MKKILFLEPVYKQMIWGGNKLRNFNYDIPYENTGEVWCISAHQNGMTKVKDFEESLEYLWENSVDFFGETKGKFPLLIKYIDACKDLSVQVHPNDEQSFLLEGQPFGKTECWYILDADLNSKIVYGHTAKNSIEFLAKAKNKKWENLLNYKNVQKNEMYLVEAGTLHAIGAGVMILEIQQSSDTTYRVYDYDRIDDNGNKRELHLEKALKVISYNEQNYKKINEVKNGNLVQLVKSQYFCVNKLIVKEREKYNNTCFTCVNIISGNGYINGIPIKKGDNFIITKLSKKNEFTGNLIAILTTT